MPSRVGKKPIDIPSGVQVGREGGTIRVKGPKGELQFTIGHGVEVALEPKTITVSQVGGGKQALALHGTTRALIANMVLGVTQGFSKALEITGTGYRAQLSGKKLTLQLGYSHPIEFDPPTGISIQLDGPTKLTVNGFDKELVGQVAANIRGFRPPEPYKGKGIKYAGEYIRRKAGKAAGGKTA
ncbi:MAG: 50S ribosomal protein L6 [Candidatus Eisenbacteria bacterium]|jgi:large subunit ribosomal protein L6|uniref:Large ribosomal subunit protein uL6 n=1 Tax=Eiseniibacteriota bacterium TaxID=2212470 RepID=A0A538TRV0_UNCEI|nr:MAG: 50S ribosomal protein L6 [Candidatus Eisenbacteria bacterium]